MNVQTENWRKIIMAICALMVVQGIREGLTSVGQFARLLTNHQNATSMIDGFQNFTTFLSYLAPVLIAALYLLIALLLWNAQRRWHENSLPTLHFVPSTLTLVGWLIVIGNITPLVQWVSLYLYWTTNGQRFALDQMRHLAFYKLAINNLVALVPSVIGSVISIVIGVLLVREAARLSHDVKSEVAVS